MLFSAIATFAALASVANAHFQLQYPAPRGKFVEDDEPSFCDGYNNAVSNRTTFPLSGGVISLKSEHPKWTVGVLVSSKANPTSFNDFNNASGGNQFVTNFFQTTGEGLACFNIDLTKTGVDGVKDGSNVTIEVVFNGGDGALYQCADLTLSSSATVPSNATTSCNNVTSQEPSSSASSSAPASTSTAAGSGAVGDSASVPGFVAGLLALTGVALAF